MDFYIHSTLFQNNGLDDDATLTKNFEKQNWKQPRADISKLLGNL